MRQHKSLHSALTSYWPLQEASGTRADLVGGNNLADINTVTQAAGVAINSAQFVSANSERLNIASNASLQTGDIDFTFNFWAYFDTKPAAASYIIKFAASAGNYEYQIYYDQAADRWKMAVCRATDLAQIVTANTFGAVSLSTWHMVTGWHDASADTVNLAINAGGVDSQATGGALQAAGTADFNLGGYSGGNFSNGRMSETGYWKRVLTQRERTWLYNNGFGRSFPFDGRYGIIGTSRKTNARHRMGHVKLNG